MELIMQNYTVGKKYSHYFSCTVYKDYNAVHNTELFVKKGDIVGIIDPPGDNVPEGFLKVSIHTLQSRQIYFKM